jgi:hypothetical protein
VQGAVIRAPRTGLGLREGLGHPEEDECGLEKLEEGDTVQNDEEWR